MTTGDTACETEDTSGKQPVFSQETDTATEDAFDNSLYVAYIIIEIGQIYIDTFDDNLYSAWRRTRQRKTPLITACIQPV